MRTSNSPKGPSLRLGSTQRVLGILVSFQLATILSVPSGWEITWSPHPDNTHLQVVYTCPETKSSPRFQAVNRWDILPTDGYAKTRRVPTPNGQSCSVSVEIIREDETVGESTYTTSTM